VRIAPGACLTAQSVKRHEPMFILDFIIHSDINCVSFPQAKRVGNPSENKERFRTSLPASGGAEGDQGRNDKIRLITDISSFEIGSTTYLKIKSLPYKVSFRHSRAGGNPCFKPFKVDPRLHGGDDFSRSANFAIGSSQMICSERKKCYREDLPLKKGCLLRGFDRPAANSCTSWPQRGSHPPE